MGKQEQLDALLAKMDSIEGSYGGTIVGKDGMLIASRLDKKFGADKIAALTSEAIKMASKIMTEAHFGNLASMVIEGAEGKMCIISTRKGSFYITLMGKSDMNLGMARLSLGDALEEFEEVL